MSETKVIEVPKDTLRKLKNISKKLKRLNTGATGDVFWIAGASSGGYSWSQLDFGVTRNGTLATCEQSGCSCYGPEEPTVDKEHSFAETISFEEDRYDPHVEAAINELVEVTDVIYKVLNNKSVSPEEVIGLPNAEVRRAVVELVGYESIVKDAKVLDESKTDGTLLKIPLKDDEDIVLVHVKDPSTTREYFLRVPPTMKSAREARAWTFGFKADDFVPIKES